VICDHQYETSVIVTYRMQYSNKQLALAIADTDYA